MRNTFNVCVSGFAGNLFTHYLDGDFSRPAEFASSHEAIEVAHAVHASTGRTVVVLFNSEQVYAVGDR